MLRIIKQNFNYRRYIWNLGLETWNDLYDEYSILKKSPLHNGNIVRNELVDNKFDWQYTFSSRILQQTIKSLNKAWKNYLNPNLPNFGKPRFKSKRRSKESFSTDRAKIINGKLRLDKPKEYDGSWYDIKLSENVRFKGILKLTTIVQNADGIYACFSIETDDVKMNTGKVINAVDVNVGHFTTLHTNFKTLTPTLIKLYKRVNFYQKLLSRKRTSNPKKFNSHNYRKVRAKLIRLYQRIERIQGDILHKFIKKLIIKSDIVGIEDLNVKHMMMNKHLAKNLHRSMFGKFRKVIEYKAVWNGKKVVVVDRYFPSTQMCSKCGYIKTKSEKMTLRGDNRYHEHDIYRCYKCGLIINRDTNAVKNLIYEVARLSA